MIKLLIVEDNQKLRGALKAGLEDTGEIKAIHDCDSGEEALAFCLENEARPRMLIVPDYYRGGDHYSYDDRQVGPESPHPFYSF